MQAIELGEPAIGALIRSDEGNARRVKALIKLQCVWMNDMLNLPRGLSEAMIERIAESVMSRYRWLTMPDVHIVFERAVSGAWNGGNYYSIVNVPMVEGWFAKYAEERMEAGERRSMEEHESRKEYRERGAEADWRRRMQRITNKQ